MKLAGLMALAVALALGPGRLEASRRTATDYVVFIDLTGSISVEQREAWASAASDLLARLSLSDSILILPIHDRTLDAAPLFVERVPDPGLALQDIARAKRRLKEIRDGARQAVRAALASRTQARATQLLAVVDRVAASRSTGRGRATRVFVFSDMLNSTPEIDMERTRLVPAGIAPLVDNLRRSARWSATALAGVRVSCILNGIDAGQRPAVNDRRVLKEFWHALFTSVGAELAGFDTFLAKE